MKTLLILRHAKAEAAVAEQTDHERPLTSRGLRDALRMGEWLEQEQLTPQLILSSTAARARETTAQVIQAGRFAGRVEFLEELYMAHPSTYIAALQQYAVEFDRALLVGHNPGMEDLVHLLTHQHLLMPTAGLAVVQVPVASWGELTLGSKLPLLHFTRPKEI